MRDGWVSWLGSLVAFVALLTDQTLARSPQPPPAASSSFSSCSAPRLIATPDIPGGLDMLVSRAPTLTVSGHDLVATETLAHGVTRTTTTDARNGFLKSLVATGPGGVLQNHAYTWDAHGNLLTRTDGVNGETETFDYDTLDRKEEVCPRVRKTVQNAPEPPSAACWEVGIQPQSRFRNRRGCSKAAVLISHRDRAAHRRIASGSMRNAG